MYIDTITFIAIYIIIFLLCVNKNESVRAVGAILLVCHLTHDMFYANTPWPAFTDWGALALAGTLILSRDPFATTVGVVMSAAHIRNLIYGDQKFYRP